MKKLLFLLFSVASLSSCQASFLAVRTPLDKCLGAATLLLGTLSTLDSVKDRPSVNFSTDVLNTLKKDLEDAKVAQDLFNHVLKNDFKEGIQLLINKPNLHIDARFGTNKQTSLMKCIYIGDASMNLVKEILKHPQLDISIKDKRGWTCLYYVCVFERPKIGKLLLERRDIGKIINEITHDNQTPLDKLFFKIKTNEGGIERIDFWRRMTRQGAVLNVYKSDYKKLTLSNKTHSAGMEVIKNNPPKGM